MINNKTKTRNSNIELYRIIVMFLIVVHHYVVNSGLLEIMETKPLSITSTFLYSIGLWGKTGINCFVLITGYFMCKKTITLRKFLKLFLEIVFYNLIIYFIFVLTGYRSLSLIDAFKAFFPIHGIATDFASCYLVFFLFIPFLNILIDKLNKQTHKTLLLLCLFVYTFLKFIPILEIRINYVGWFCVLYIFGAYISLNPFKKDTDTRYWGLMLVCLIIISILSVIAFRWARQYGSPIQSFYLVSDSNAPLAVMTAFCAFMFFKNLKVRQSKIINILGAGTFGVLLIHANSDVMRSWLWKDFFNNVSYYNTMAIYYHAIIAPILVFAICSLIELIRMKVVELPLLNLVEGTVKKMFPFLMNSDKCQRL